MSEVEKRKHRCCFTGHRPEKMDVATHILRSALEEEIRIAIKDGYYVFISGMARGIDLMAAEIVIRLRDEEHVDIKLIAASPYEGFNKWSDHWKERYEYVLKKADLVRFVCPHYHSGCFQLRNQWMVDHSSRVIAAYNGSKGGTANTIRYAQMHNIEVRNIL